MQMSEKTSIPRLKAKYLAPILDMVLSVAASLLAILAVRWQSDPIPGFAAKVWVWMGIACLGVIVGGFLSALWRHDVRIMDGKTTGRVFVTILVKEFLMMAALFFGLVTMPSRLLSTLLLLFDTVLSALFFLAPRYLLMALRKEEKAVNEIIGQKLALVVGTDAKSVMMAEGAAAFGRYKIIGYLTDKPEMAGKTIAKNPVYFCDNAQDLFNLQWKLGGFDSILFPMGTGFRNKGKDTKRDDLTKKDKKQAKSAGNKNKNGGRKR